MGVSLESLAEDAQQLLLCGSGAAPRLGLEPSHLEAVYAVGHSLYKEGDYDRAEELFSWLVVSAGMETKYLKALGAARQLQGKYEEALAAYAVVITLEAGDPEVVFHTAECVSLMGDKQKARELAACACSLAKTYESPKALMKQINSLQRSLGDGEETKQGDK